MQLNQHIQDMCERSGAKDAHVLLSEEIHDGVRAPFNLGDKER